MGLIGDSLTEGRPGVSFFTFLKKEYPNMTFVNLGKSGETVISLQTRLSKLEIDKDYDLIFLWIGVNDVYSNMLKVQAQPVVKNHEEFQEVYTKLIDMIRPFTKRIVAICPAIIGENIKNDANMELRELAVIIESITSKHDNVSYLDMIDVFEKHLVNANSSDYIGTGVITIMKDALLYRNPTRIDRLSKKRGLYLTLDGVHLNSLGANIVAKEYGKMIMEQS